MESTIHWVEIYRGKNEITIQEKKAKEAIELVGGAQNTLPIDRMLTCEYKEPTLKMWHVLAQVDALDCDLINGGYRIKKDLIKLKWKKRINFFLRSELLDLDIQQIEWNINNVRKMFERAIERKKNFEQMYSDMEASNGNLTMEDVNRAVVKANVIRLFEMAIAQTMALGTGPGEGVFLYRKEIGELANISDSQLRAEIMNFCFHEKDGRIEFSIYQQKDVDKFLMDMADRYS